LFSNIFVRGHRTGAGNIVTLVNYNSHIYFIYISKSKLVDGRHCTKAAACPPGMSVLPNVFGILLYYSTARLHNLTAFVRKHHVIISKIISFPEISLVFCDVVISDHFEHILVLCSL